MSPEMKFKMNPKMNPRMSPAERSTEERIDTVLRALRQAQPAPGMEQRITAALLRAHDAASPAKQRWTWLRMPQIAVLAVVVAAALLVSAHIYRAGTTPVKGRAAMEKAAGFSPLNRTLPMEGLQPRPAFTGAEAPSQPQRVSGLKAAASSGNTNADPGNAHAASGSANADPGNVTAASKSAKAASGNLIAASESATAAIDARRAPRTREASQNAEQANTGKDFPAPPLPLTEQERLLVRLVHREDPVQLAQLAPAAREAELQREREQVHEFFKAPPMLAANFKLEPYPTPGGTQ